jgi:hypothetical protein
VRKLLGGAPHCLGNSTGSKESEYEEEGEDAYNSEEDRSLSGHPVARRNRAPWRQLYKETFF